MVASLIYNLQDEEKWYCMSQSSFIWWSSNILSLLHYSAISNKNCIVFSAKTSGNCHWRLYIQWLIIEHCNRWIAGSWVELIEPEMCYQHSYHWKNWAANWVNYRLNILLLLDQSNYHLVIPVSYASSGSASELVLLPQLYWPLPAWSYPPLES